MRYLIFLLFITNCFAAQCIFDEQYTKELIIKHEGIRKSVYKDTLGNKTIGVGHNLETPINKEIFGKYYWLVCHGAPLTTKQIERLLDFDFRIAVATAVNYMGAKQFFLLHPKAQSVLIDMSFNLGNRIKQFKNLKKCLLQYNYKGAAKEMQQSKWYKQTGNRAKELVEIMSKCTHIKKGR